MPEEEPIIKPEKSAKSSIQPEKVEFVAARVAIDVHNGLYGRYVNEQAIRLSAAGFKKDQIDEVLLIASTIAR